MARALRVEYPGAIYHVTVRGNAQQDIFRDDTDHHLLNTRLAKSTQTYQVRLYLFCQMDNHFHLVLETPNGNLGRFMQSVLTGYTVCYNLRHRCHGHLTQGRYGARLVAGNEYLLKLSRYVHLNPVKVKDKITQVLPERIKYLGIYKWSSYRSYIGLAKRLEWVDYGPMLALMGGHDKERMERYRYFMEAGIAVDDEEFIAAMNRSARSIGEDDFREWVDERHEELLKERKHPEDVTLRREMGRCPEPEIVLAAVASAAGTTVEGLKARRRNWIWKGIAARLLVTQSGLTQRECTGWLGVRAGSVMGYQIKRAAIVLESDARLARRVTRLESQLKTG
ncbi:MAG: transposase [Verrucomicrobia bacterium]|nr:transposase [Verrucomicrobiota bacterium]MBU1736221.1 transposase [Verrucomicrobiota bacterium]MBU1857400.1 transposase [Verrucomicrobiota bacterium]